jgi:hypothetical protein
MDWQPLTDLFDDHQREFDPVLKSAIPTRLAAVGKR